MTDVSYQLEPDLDEAEFLMPRFYSQPGSTDDSSASLGR